MVSLLAAISSVLSLAGIQTGGRFGVCCSHPFLLIEPREAASHCRDAEIELLEVQIERPRVKK